LSIQTSSCQVQILTLANKCYIDLRPVEEFRHTPIIPISERDLALHKKTIDEANRKGYYVEIRKDTLYFYGTAIFTFHHTADIAIACLSLGIISYIFLMVNEKQMRIKHDLERTKMLRVKANEGRKGMSIQAERARENLLAGRSIM